jgi:hypothetical protein
VNVPAALPNALKSLGLGQTVGHLCLFPAQMCCLPGRQSSSSGRDVYFVPYAVNIGVPLYKPALCKEVCHLECCQRVACLCANFGALTCALSTYLRAVCVCLQVCRSICDANVLSAKGQTKQVGNQAIISDSLATFISKHGMCLSRSVTGQARLHMTAEKLEAEPILLPQRRLLFDGNTLSTIEGWACTQGSAVQGRMM